MITRLELIPHIKDPHYDHVDQFKIDYVKADIYTFNQTLETKDKNNIKQLFKKPFYSDPLIYSAQDPLDYSYYKTLLPDFKWCVEIGFNPGVTDNCGQTAKQVIAPYFNNYNEIQISSSYLLFILADISEDVLKHYLSLSVNPLIKRISIKNSNKFDREKGMDIYFPFVNLSNNSNTISVDLNVKDEELSLIASKGIADNQQIRRGPLGLSLAEMKAIQTYFKNQGRAPSDIELETIAQTWSEHCKHKIFASPIDDVKDGIYKTYIKGATRKIREQSGDNDICVSVFNDNSGAIKFDDNWLVTDKVETHNTPSALDPFGGSITGVVGVNRDCIGFGKGAKPILNRYGFCFSPPDNLKTYYRSPNKQNPTLSNKFIISGVIKGIKEGGNHSGIPSPQGFVYFNDRYSAKPLVFAGTVGLIPKNISNSPSDQKGAKPKDKIVLVGGRTGKDGIHGATFSSEALNEGSPITAVQIGDPITQKKLSDAILKEAREKGLYNSITDNGAGGLSSSIGEMAEQSGGCQVYLDKVPTKYPGLQPWEIWISESQERMTLAVPNENIAELFEIFKKHDVEATIIGFFDNSGMVKADYNTENILKLDLGFLHKGWPKIPLKTSKPSSKIGTKEPSLPTDYKKVFCDLLQRPNLTSYEFISTQYDHEVQGTSILKPLQGKGRVNSHISAIKPLFNSNKAILVTQSLNPSYSEINSYNMAAASIDQAICQAIAGGASLDHLALLDNFCWCDSYNPERLYQLKQAGKACYDYAISYGTPFISGKDSMFNDFRGYDANSNPIHISIPPTLLISVLAVINNYQNLISLDPKAAGDMIYLLGETKEELGGSEYFDEYSCFSNKSPQTDAQKNKSLYRDFSKATNQNIIASSLAVHSGGLGYALIKKAIAGQFGLAITLPNIDLRPDYFLFSQSTGRILVTIAPENKSIFEQLFQDHEYHLLGQITKDKMISMNWLDKTLLDEPLETFEQAYKRSFKC